MENKKELIEAVLAVMEECQWIDKGTTVGTGSYSYKWVSDKDVKLKVGWSMRKHGLVILPTDVTPIRVEKTEWEEHGKTKRSYFTELVTKYTLYHKSGASTQLAGYGQWVDTQDKWAGKATTYALKYTLLYSFLVATGHIDDTDNTHSDDIEMPPAPKKKFTKEDLERLAEKPDVFIDSIIAIEKIGEKWELTSEDVDAIKALYR